jgi:succinate dehydrogenase/fumarate reductase flavoprotein subunit
MAEAAARDHRYDVVVLGTGAAGRHAAARAAARSDGQWDGGSR